MGNMLTQTTTGETKLLFCEILILFSDIICLNFLAICVLVVSYTKKTTSDMAFQKKNKKNNYWLEIFSEKIPPSPSQRLVSIIFKIIHFFIMWHFGPICFPMQFAENGLKEIKKFNFSRARNWELDWDVDQRNLAGYFMATLETVSKFYEWIAYYKQKGVNWDCDDIKHGLHGKNWINSCQLERTFSLRVSFANCLHDVWESKNVT